jgi:hypothetical protein
VPGAPRAALSAVLLVAGLVAGCGNNGRPAQVLPVVPAPAPPGGPTAAGIVTPLDAPATQVVVDPRTATVVVALVDPPRLMLRALDGAAPARQVALPGPAAGLVLAADGGPLVVPITAPGAVIQVPLEGGAPSRIELDGAAYGAVARGDVIVVAMGDRLTVLDRSPRGRTIPGFAGAARLVPVGSKLGVLDRGRSAVSLVDVTSGETSPALRTGDGAAGVVSDRFGRMLVTDTRDGELLAVAGDPPLLRQRFPLPGAPYGMAYDAQRDLVWVTLTARNEVVGLNVAGGEPVIVHRFPTVHQPNAVAVDPASGRVVVVSASGAGLQVINPERVVR